MTPSGAIEHVLAEIEIQPPITVEDCAGLRDLIRELVGDGPLIDVHFQPTSLIVEVRDSGKVTRRTVNLGTGEVAG